MRNGLRLALVALSFAASQCAGGSAEPNLLNGSGGSGGGSHGSSSGASGGGSSGGASGGGSSNYSSSNGSSSDPGTSGGSPSGSAPSGSSSGPTGSDDASTSSSTSSSGSSGSSSGTTGSSPNPAGCFQSTSTDYTQDGPFMATSGDVTSVSCTIIRPTTLGTNGCKNPLIVWGNGTFNTPSTYAALFNHWATQGFIVAAADTSNAGSGKEMIACLEYMLQQNTTSGSPYEGNIDTSHIASSGYSQGGAGCLEAGIDPRFTVTAPVSPYIVLSLGGYDTTSVMKQVHPMFMISGSADTVAPANNNQQPIFDTAPVPIVWGTHAGSTHFEVLNNGGAYNGPLTAWFRYKLMGDETAGNWFKKSPCTLCSTTGWTVQFNSLWTD